MLLFLCDDEQDYDSVEFFLKSRKETQKIHCTSVITEGYVVSSKVNLSSVQEVASC